MLYQLCKMFAPQPRKKIDWLYSPSSGIQLLAATIMQPAQLQVAQKNLCITRYISNFEIPYFVVTLQS